MRIVADSKIAQVEEAFSSLGEVTRTHTEELTAAMIRNAQVLLVRSETRVNQALLADSSVEFVGSATIGVDHVDQEYLRERGIAFAAAPGSNARSVAEYVVAAALELSGARGEPLAGRSLGVVGVGNIGRLVAAAGAALGMRVLCNDPPRARQEPDSDFVSLAEALQADLVTAHVPLTREGPDPTWHLVARPQLSRMRTDTTLINTSRGAVVDNTALRHSLENRQLRGAVLDVWEGEPDIDQALLELTDFATPHIAGYSWDGKIRGTRMLLEACCRHFGRRVDWRPPAGPNARAAADFGPDVATLESRLLRLVRRSYSIRLDDQRLRGLLTVPPAARAHYFRRLRREYPVRREFSSIVPRGASKEEGELLSRLGFGSSADDPAAAE